MLHDSMAAVMLRFLTRDSLRRRARRLTTDPRALERFAGELAASGLLVRINEAKREFETAVSGTTYRGDPYGFGGMSAEVSVRLYGLVRELRPGVLVETGVCNGVSTAVILCALERNGAGKLHSIDLPEHTDTVYDQDDFWEGKKGAAVPKDKAPGWVIPDELRERWELELGRSQDELQRLLHRLGAIDFFLHDSEHSPECMSFEYQAAWKHLRSGGVLASDDVRWNTVFEDFARERARETHQLSENLTFIVK